MAGTVYRKTDAGREAIARRGAGLEPAARRLLILVNGSETTAAFEALGLNDVRLLLERLLALGLIEPVPAPVIEPGRLSALQRQALHRLTPHFGPDTALVAQALIAASSPDEYQRALDAIQAKLAIYMGRKQAARELASLQWAG